MSSFWFALGFILVLVAGLVLAVLGLVGQFAELRQEVHAKLGPPVDEFGAMGLPPGSLAPSFETRALGGGRFSSAELLGHDVLLVFAHPNCRPCNALWPHLIAGARDGLPPVVVVSRGRVEDFPVEWRLADKDNTIHLIIVLESGDEISSRYRIYAVPAATLIDDGGRVGRSRVVNSPDDLDELVLAAKSTQRNAHAETERATDWGEP